MNTSGQADLVVQYNYNKSVYDLEQSIKVAVIMVFNQEVPPEYRRIPNAVGTREFQITNSPQDILTSSIESYIRTIIANGTNAHGK